MEWRAEEERTRVENERVLGRSLVSAKPCTRVTLLANQDGISGRSIYFAAFALSTTCHTCSYNLLGAIMATTG